MNELKERSTLIMEDACCPACGGRDISNSFHATDNWGMVPEWSGQEFTYAQCKECRLYYLNPRPNPRSMQRYYADGYISHTSALGVDEVTAGAPPILQSDAREVVSLTGQIKEWLYMNRWGSSAQVRWKKRLLISFLKLLWNISAEPLFFHGRDKMCLDYGCGIGGYAASMKANGWKSFGMDVNINAIMQASKISRIPAGVSCAEQIPVKSGSMDAVTMNYVLEHLYNPVAVITDVNRILKPYGTFMLSVPNAKSITLRLEKEYWIGADAPRHLAIWTPESICSLLSNSGFNVDWIYNISSTSSITAAIEFWIRKKVFNIKRDRIRKNIILRNIAKPFVRLFDILSVGENLRIIATKTNN